MATRGVKRKLPKNPPRIFKDEWMALFPEWLAPVPGLPTRALCQLCSKEMNAELTQLKRHEVNKINAFESNK